MSTSRYLAAVAIAEEAGCKDGFQLARDIEEVVSRYRRDALVVLLRTKGKRLLRRPDDIPLIKSFLDAIDWAVTPETAPLRDALLAEDPERIRVAARPLIHNDPESHKRGPKHDDAMGALYCNLLACLHQHRVPVSVRNVGGDRMDATTVAVRFVASVCGAASLPIPATRGSRSLGERFLKECIERGGLDDRPLYRDLASEVISRTPTRIRSR